MKSTALIWMAVAFVALASVANGATVSRDPAPLKPQVPSPGIVRIWGPAAMQKVVDLWARDFHARHPKIAVKATLMGSDTAIPGLYSGRADIALLGRHDDVTDDNGFSRPNGYKFRRIELMGGSLGTDGESPALAVLVNRNNPVSKLTLAQLASIAGCRCLGHGHTVRTWGDLGAGGKWAARPVHLYLPDTDSGTGIFFLHAVLNDNRKLDWQVVTDFRDVRRANGTINTAAQRAANALARDPYGIAISTLGNATPAMKAAAISVTDKGPFVLPAQATVIAQTYPLARRTYAFVNVPPGRQLDPNVAEFLRFSLGPFGQADVRKAGTYLPLSRGTDRLQLKALGDIAEYPTADVAASRNGSGSVDAVLRALPNYTPQAQVSGTISIWGHGSSAHNFMGTLIGAWMAEFHRYQPGVHIEDHLYGTASAIGALYTGAGNLALLGEEISPDTRRAFIRAKGYPPARIEIATGSVAENYFDYAHMIFVNRANPISGLSLSQLDAIFGDGHIGPGHNARQWGAVGLTGAWANKPIDPYAWTGDEDFGLFFGQRVLQGSHRWNPETTEFETTTRGDGTTYDRGTQILQALAKDRYGIAISNIRFATPAVKMLPLSWKRGGPYYFPSSANLMSQRYPLTRIIPAFVDLPPGRKLDPALKEFLRFMLSRQGQVALVEYTGYLPLGSGARKMQLEHLK